MGRKPAEIPRTVMKVPVTFQNYVDELAEARGVSAQKLLENAELVIKEE